MPIGASSPTSAAVLPVERDAARSVVIHVGEVDGDVLDGGVHAVRRGDNMQNMLGRGLIIHAGLELHDPIGSTHLDREKIAVLCESEVVEEIAVGIGGREDADAVPAGVSSPIVTAMPPFSWMFARSVVVDIVEIDGDRLGLGRYAVCGRGDVQDVLDRRLIIEAGLEPDLPSGSILHDFEERAGFGKCIARNRVSVAIRGGEDADDGTDRSILPDPQTVRAVEKDFARSMVVHVGYLDDDILNRGGLSVGGGCDVQHVVTLGHLFVVDPGLEPRLPVAAGQIVHDFEDVAVFGKSIGSNGVAVGIGRGQGADDAANLGVFGIDSVLEPLSVMLPGALSSIFATLMTISWIARRSVRRPSLSRAVCAAPPSRNRRSCPL